MAGRLSDIRVTYSGLVSFVIGLIGIVTGTFFTLIVTRTLTPTEFGTWGLIYNLISYVVVIEPVISYWATREIARGIGSAKTAIISSGLISIAGMIVYLIIAYFVGQQTPVDKNVLFFAAISVPFMFLNRTLTAINLGCKPHSVSYGLFFFGITQIPIGIILLNYLHLGVSGVILTNIVSSMASITILSIYSREIMRYKIKKEFIIKWIKFSWISLFPSVASMIHFLDIVIFSVITNSVIGIAFWSASMAILTLVSQSGLISRAVYPKLLGLESSEYLKENMTQLFFFAIPLAALVIVFAKPLLFALNPVYETAVPVVILLTLHVFFNNLSGVFQSFLMGIEKVDLDKKSTFKEYSKSKLFFIPKMLSIQYSLYVSILAVMLLFIGHVNSKLDLVIYWSMIALVTHIPFTTYFYVLVKRSFDVKLDLPIILKYLLISIGVFGFTYIVTEKFLDYGNNIFQFLPKLLLFMSIGMGIYLVITYVVDSRTRKLFNAIIQEIKEKKI